MTKYMKYSAARDCKVHKEIAREAVAFLKKRGVFSKSEVLRETQFEAVKDAIRWDYVRRMIEEDEEVDLIPLGEAFWKRHRKDEERKYPEKFIASGNGKRTFGYATATVENSHFVIKRLQQRQNMVHGGQVAVDKMTERAVEHGVSLPVTSEVPQIEAE